MTTWATAPPGTSSRVWIALHNFVTGRKRRWATTPPFRSSSKRPPFSSPAFAKHRKK